MKNFFHWAVLCILLFVLQEVLFRVIFPLPEVENFNRVNYVGASPQTKTASFLGQRTPAMHATFRWNSKPDGTSYESHLNLYGFRDADWRIRPDRDKERVMFVGDSLVEGFMATDKATISRGYGRATIERQRAVEAMNFGIGGTGIDNYLDLMRDAVPLFRPQRLIVVLYANDFPLSSAPREIGPTFTPIFIPAVMPRSLLIIRRAWRREVVPRRWHERPTLFVPVVPDPLNSWSQPPAEYSRVDPTLADAMRKGEFNPFAVDLLNRAEKALRQPIEPAEVLRQFQQIAQGAPAELRIVYLPFSTQVSDYYVPFQEQYALEKGVHSLLGPEYQIHSQAIAKSCQELGIPFLDLTPLLRKAEADQEHLYWNFDEHMRGFTYLRVGATIERWVHSTEKMERLILLK
ncbi:MAG: hypothetical protein QOJ45_253 [Verrucomicrobiota bacterium]